MESHRYRCGASQVRRGVGNGSGGQPSRRQGWYHLPHRWGGV